MPEEQPMSDRDGVLKGWGDFFLSTAGGIALGGGLWLLLKRSCPLGVDGDVHRADLSGLALDCVRVGDVEWYRSEFLFGASVLAIILGITIHALRR